MITTINILLCRLLYLFYEWIEIQTHTFSRPQKWQPALIKCILFTKALSFTFLYCISHRDCLLCCREPPCTFQLSYAPAYRRAPFLPCLPRRQDSSALRAMPSLLPPDSSCHTPCDWASICLQGYFTAPLKALRLPGAYSPDVQMVSRSFMARSENLTWVCDQHLWAYLEWETLFNISRKNLYMYTSPYFLNRLSYFGSKNSEDFLLRDLLLGS